MLLTLILTAHAIEFADMEVAECQSLTQDSRPEDGAIDVPVDVRLLFPVAGNICFGRSVAVTLSSDDGVVESRMMPAGEFGNYFAFKPDQTLAPLTEYTLSVVTPVGSIEEITFTTGEDSAPQAPTAEDLSLQVFGEQDRTSIDYSATLDITIDDPTGLSLVQLFRDDVLMSEGPTGALPAIVATWSQPDLLEEVCMDLVVQDAAGVAGAPVPLCATPSIQDTRGCSTTGGGTGMVWLGLFALLCRRKR